MHTLLNDLTVVFLGILLESLPFVILGSLIASIINQFVSDNTLYKCIPKNRFLGLIIVSMLGILFPVCDCTIIPVMRRLVHKGLPSSFAVTFMCAVPIVNPTVIVSTFWAFTNQTEIVWLRMIVGMWTAIAAGLIVGKITSDNNPLLSSGKKDHLTHTCECCDTDLYHKAENHSERHSVEAVALCRCAHSDHHSEQSGPFFKNLLKRIQKLLSHTTDEFLDNIPYIIIGAFLSAILQMVVPRTIMYPISTNPVMSVSAMMGFTWLISLCANADAFVAKSFSGIFTTGSLVAFMTFGQMIDLKNTVVMLGYFKKRFVVVVITVIAIICFTWGVMINLLGRGL